MTAISVFHVGILVKDIGEAAGRFGSVLGLTFEMPREIDIVLEESGISTERNITVAYSVEGPPFLELIQSQSEGLWGHHHGEGLHHIGCWEGDIEARLQQMAALGTRADVKIFVGGLLTAAYLPKATLHGARFELVARH